MQYEVRGILTASINSMKSEARSNPTGRGRVDTNSYPGSYSQLIDAGGCGG